MKAKTPKMITLLKNSISEKCLTKNKFFSWNIAILFLTFLLAFILALNFFFCDGAPLLDQGQLVGVLWKNSLFLKDPPWFANQDSSFFADHITLFKLLWSLTFSFLPLTPVFNFALFHACGVTLLIFAIQQCMQIGLNLKGINLYLTPLFALGFLFSGFVMAYNNYPHYEIYAVAFGLLFLLNLGERKYPQATFYFLLSLIVREDIGFHLAGLLICIQVLKFSKEKFFHTREFLFIVSGILYSVSALTCQKLFFGEFKVVNIYFGSSLSHLSLDILYQRLTAIFSTKQFLWVPILTLASAAISLRSSEIALGIIAFIPWFLFNILSANPLAATFQLYFTLFFIFVVFWPSLMHLFFKIQEHAFLKVKYKSFLFFLQGLLIAQSVIFNPYSLRSFTAKFTPQTLSQLETLAQTLPQLINNPTDKWVIDDAIAVINPNQFNSNNLLSKIDTPVNTLLFFANHGPNFIEALYAIIIYKLDNIYAYGNTNVYLATNQNKANSVIPWLIKQNISHEKNWKEFLEAFSFRMMNSYHFSSQNSNHLFSEDSKKYDYFGPNLPIPPGEYLFAIHITSPEKNGIKAQIELLKENDKSTLKSEVLSLEKDETFQFKFNIPKNKKTTRYSFIIRCNKGKFIIKDFSLKKR